MKKNKKYLIGISALIFLIAAISVMLFMRKGESLNSLEDNFLNPPDETKPWVYWYWISDHISKEGITKDIEAMADVGIGEAFIGNVDVLKENKGDVKTLTENWFQMIDHAIKEGKRVGVNIGLFNSPGWSQSGGTWNKPEHSMRYLTMTETKVVGPCKVNQKLIKPDSLFQDVAVIAYLSPKNDTDKLSPSSSFIKTVPQTQKLATWFDGNCDVELKLPVSKSKSFIIDFEQKSPYTMRSLMLFPSKKGFSANCELKIKQENGLFVSVKKFNIERSNINTNVGFLPFAPICETFKAVSSKNFRLEFYDIEGEASFTEISLSSSAKMERFAEKELAKLWSTPSPMWDAYMWEQPAEIDDSELVVNPQKLINISSNLKYDGTLVWNAPKGEWIIQRVGMLPTGQTNAPASVEATGLEVDKMNKKWVDAHFDAYIGKIINRLSVEDRKSLKHVVADSYETSAQNWTDGLVTDFKKKYGYDPIPFLPVMFGRVVGSADMSERFLWDLRRMIADRISYEYVGALREKSNKYGLNLWLENYGHWGFPGEFLQYGGQADEVSGEFWTGTGLGDIELKAASSAAHGYGKKIVHCEAFTTGSTTPKFSLSPWALKTRGDWAVTKGINHFVLHVYVHQPYPDKIPGVNAWFGIEFNRYNTWFYKSKEWIKYLRRSHFMLQQGKYVADVAYFIGEDAPKMTGIQYPNLPSGYNFDFVNAEIINSMRIENGRFTLPDGMNYGVLILPPQTTMRPDVLHKLDELISDGGIVVGNPPTKSPSMHNYPECDKTIREIAKNIWKNCDDKTVKNVKHGKGTVYCGTELTEILEDLAILPEIENLDNNNFLWTHREIDNNQIFYISNQTDDNIKTSPIFRVNSIQPELWDPVNAEIRDLNNFKENNGRTTVSLEFAPRQSYFIVFRKSANKTNSNSSNFPEFKTVIELNENWSVHFGKKLGTPDSLSFEKLTDWTLNKDINVKYFSGTARYRKSFDMPAYNKQNRIYLNLGEFNSIAEVFINNKQVDVVWAKPHRVDITRFIKEKGNILDIEITNTWNNRLVGDVNMPIEKRMTNIIISPKYDAPLMESGLIGPVLIQILEK